MKDITCRLCGKQMHNRAKSLPQGKATCHECRRVNPPEKRSKPRPLGLNPNRTMNCAGCGGQMWRSRSSKPAGEAYCRPCRSAGLAPRKGGGHRTPCVECGTPSSGVRCRPCSSRARRIRPVDDYRVRRWHRDQAAPGLSQTAKNQLRAKWKAQHRLCAYCPALGTTIDHVVPLVRGGTNYEGNLVPCCRRCNSSKAAKLLVEWRNNKPAAQTHATGAVLTVVLTRPKTRRPKRLIVLTPCPVCADPCERMTCSAACSREWTCRMVRDQYRRAHGIPVDHAIATKPRSRQLLLIAA